MIVQPYLFFDGCCEEAVEFYRETLGAEVLMTMRFKDAPEMPADAPSEGCGGGPPGDPEKIMHCSFRVGNSLIMASDGQCGGAPKFDGFALSISAADEAQARSTFEALAKGGQVTAPMMATFFSPAFGMVQDRFGVHWMVLVDVAPPQG